MGLYLAILDKDDDELDGVQVGSYEDWGRFRDCVVASVLRHECPELVGHSDCDGEWTVAQCTALVRELEEIAEEFKHEPAIEFAPDSWQRDVAKTFGLAPANLYESFFDVDGEPLLDRLISLAHRAQETGLPILFQ